jgi:hypothetical protein
MQAQIVDPIYYVVLRLATSVRVKVISESSVKPEDDAVRMRIIPGFPQALSQNAITHWRAG